MRLVPLRSGRKVEVQMSPLIDVVFLLLLFYAVTTQFVNDERLKLKLPEAETAESVGTNQEEKPPEVKVAVDGSIWINDEIVPEEELETRMRQIVEQAPDDGIQHLPHIRFSFRQWQQRQAPAIIVGYVDRIIELVGIFQQGVGAVQMAQCPQLIEIGDMADFP